jgi:moderate conductance mechanosensitive channel
MRNWLDQIIPQGALHLWLVDGVEFGVRLLLILLLYTVARWVTGRALDALMHPLSARARQEGPTSVTRLQTLEGLSRSAVRYALLFVMVVMLLGEAGIRVEAILASAGVAGLAISFGAQRLVRDVLTGFFFLLEDQFRVGEMVTLVTGPGLPQYTGNILEMGLRVTRLNDLTGKLVTVANGDITAVINHHRGPVTATVEVGVPVDAPLGRIRELVSGLPMSEELFAGEPQVEGVSSLEGGRMVVRIAAPAIPGKAPQAELALRQAVGEALRGEEIELK